MAAAKSTRRAAHPRRTRRFVVAVRRHRIHMPIAVLRLRSHSLSLVSRPLTASPAPGREKRVDHRWWPSRRRRTEQCSRAKYTSWHARWASRKCTLQQAAARWASSGRAARGRACGACRRCADGDGRYASRCLTRSPSHTASVTADRPRARTGTSFGVVECRNATTGGGSWRPPWNSHLAQVGRRGERRTSTPLRCAQALSGRAGREGRRQAIRLRAFRQGRMALGARKARSLSADEARAHAAKLGCSL